MNKYLVILFALTVNFTFSQAGSNISGGSYGNSSSFTGNGIWVKNSEANTNLKGSPYLFDSWTSSSALIYSADNRAYKFNNLNYNVRLERFEAKFSEDSILAFNPKNIDKIVIHNRTFKRYLDNEFQRNSYFEELVVTNSVIILRKFEIGIKEGVVNPLTHQKTTDDEMIVKEKYYYTTDGENLKFIQLKKSSILKTLDADKRDLVKEYAKENKLSFKEINELKKILEYYNTL
ncbi:hypothetical protein [Bizionia arctica]|uniref:Uncharacterized protein n=1 Tax=Bizionia arctica TaxID=1495645 RepID=A0A917GEQ6_9FLAO|nr:hypothetical protein [Bizionia arctica]GGG42305.1 hypothetical protein GCM10010976_12310 [Bizionia arctica]